MLINAQILPSREFYINKDKKLDLGNKIYLKRIFGAMKRYMKYWKPRLMLSHDDTKPSVGEVSDLELKEDGIYANIIVEDEKVKKEIGKGWKYVSAGFSLNYTADDGEEYAGALHEVSLTSKPVFAVGQKNLDIIKLNNDIQLYNIVDEKNDDLYHLNLTTEIDIPNINLNLVEKEMEEKLERILEMLQGLTESLMADRKEKKETVEETVEETLSKSDEAKDDEKVAEVKTDDLQNASLSKKDDLEVEVQKLQKEVHELRLEKLRNTAEKAVDSVMLSKRIPSDKKEFLIELAMDSETKFANIVDMFPDKNKVEETERLSISDTKPSFGEGGADNALNKIRAALKAQEEARKAGKEFDFTQALKNA